MGCDVRGMSGRRMGSGGGRSLHEGGSGRRKSGGHYTIWCNLEEGGGVTQKEHEYILNLM